MNTISVVDGLRVAQMIESDGPGGAESVVLALCNGLRDRGAHVHSVGFAGGEGWLSGRLRSAGFEPFQPRIRRDRRVDVQLVKHLSNWIQSNSIDLLHAHEYTMAVYAAAAGLLTGKPHIITMHGGVYYASAWHRKAAFKWAAQRAAALVGVSERTNDQLAENLSLKRSQIELVQNGVVERYGDRHAGRKMLGVAPHCFVMLAVGNLYPVKDHATLVETAKLLAADEQLPEWQLLIAGRGDQELALRAKITEAGLEGRVRLLGLRDDIPQLLAASDAWLMSSLSEGLPMAMLEAMMAGVPVVSTAVGGIPALITNGETGWLVEPRQPAEFALRIRQILLNPDEATSIGAKGRQLAMARYGVDVMLDRYARLYGRALG